MWTTHKASECKRYPLSKISSTPPVRISKGKKQDDLKRKKDYLQAKAALNELKLSPDSEEESSDDDSTAKKSYSIKHISDDSNTS
jgi:hypothetical protein